MAFSSKVFSFDKSTSTATPLDQSITGMGFQPEAIIFYASANNTVTDGLRTSIGFSDGTNNRAIGFSSSDAVTTTNTARIDSDQFCYNQVGDGGATHVQFKIKTFDADGFTITYSTNTTGAYKIYGIAFGGTDMTNAKVGTFNFPTTTGSFTVTGVGFTPSAVFTLTTLANATTNNTAIHLMASLGFASSSSKRMSEAITSRDGLSAADAARVQKETKAFVTLTTSGTNAVQHEADFTAPTSDGWTYNVTAATSGTSFPVFYLAIAGGRWDCQTVDTRSTVGTQAITTGFTPKLAILTTAQNDDEAVVTDDARLAFGAASSTTDRACIWFGDVSTATPTQTARSSSLTNTLQTRTVNATGANSGLTRAIDLQSFDSGTGLTLNYSTMATTTVIRLNVITVGDSATTSTVSKSYTAKYGINAFVSKINTALYHLGGAVTAGPITHTYNILGTVSRALTAKYHISALVNNSNTAKYNVTAAGGATISKSYTAKYHISQLISKSATIVFDIAEDPTLNLRRYLKPMGLRIFIMSHDMKETYHVFNSFDFEESSFLIQSASVTLSMDDAGSFDIFMDDSLQGIDTSLVGEGNAVLMQAAKTQADLEDGKHNLMMGYITSKKVTRTAGDRLKYTFSGFGSAIRFNERLTSFSRSARRAKHDSPEPDTTDDSMQAWKLFRDLLTTTDHMPIGGPLESQFSVEGITDISPRVDDFLSQIDEELAEMSSPMDTIADNAGASWYVTPDNIVFLRYMTLEPSGIVIKSKVDPEFDDRFKTGYIDKSGGLEFTDSRDKSQGFTNRFIIRVGLKDATSNVIELADIKDQFDPLAVNIPPTQSESGTPLPPNFKAQFGPIVNIRADVIGPFSSVWTIIANFAREFDLNRFYVVMKLGTGDDGPGPSIGLPDWVNPWNEMTNASVRMLGYVNTDSGNKSESAVRAEIDRWVDTWGPWGIFLQNMSSSTSPTVLSYYESIAAYAKSRGSKFVVANLKQSVADAVYTACPSINVFVIREGSGLPTKDDLWQSWYNDHLPGTRAVFSHSVTTQIATDDDVAQWVSNQEIDNTSSWVYVTHDTPNTDPWDVLSNRFRAMMFGAERAAVRILQDNGFIVPDEPVQQDLAMSFPAETQNINDLAIIVSKVGNPLPNQDESNALYVEILPNREVVRTDEDEQTGQTTTVQVDMPHYTAPIAYARIPYTEIQTEFPTVIFLHRFIKRKRDITVGNRYWVVLYGRGQDENNTVRWHHANDVGFEYLSARRVPAAVNYRTDNQRLQWEVFSNQTHPGFALSFFKNTTHQLEASDPDSIERFGPVESELDLTGVDDDAMAIKAAQAILNFSAKPKRVYSISAVTLPDELILPSMLVNIKDEMTTLGQVAGSSEQGIDAQITSVTYDFDVNGDSPWGCRFVDIDAIGHVDFQWAYWKAKYDRGDVTVDFPDIPPPPVSPPPDTRAPVIYAKPRGGNYATAIAVQFVSNKSGTTVYYTTDGSTPTTGFSTAPSTDTFTLLAASQNPTRSYIPGQSADIIITSTTTLKFQGIDQAGNKSALYTELYTIPVPPVPVNTGKKFMWSVFWKPASNTTIASTFSSYTDRQMDSVTYHKRITETYDTAYQNSMIGIPAVHHEVEFEGYDDMVANVATAKAAGADVIGYNIEEDDRYPDKDRKDVVGYCKKFSDYVKNLGLKVKFNPSAEFTRKYGGRIVSMCDFYNIQSQHLQGQVDPFRSWVKDTSQALRANHSKIVITITLSADTTQHQTLSGQSMLETLKHRSTYAVRWVDGIKVFYSGDTQLTTTVSPFMSWFNTNARTLG